MAEGSICFLDGDPSCGKTSIALDLAARVTVGNKLPESGKCQPGSVIIMVAEDDAANTVIPRLVAGGADLARVHFFGLSADQAFHDLPRFPEATGPLEQLIRSTEARLVVVDPYMPFLAHGLNPYVEKDVRDALGPVTMMAQRTGAAILMIRHLTKNASAKKIYRGGGSIGITAIARTVLQASYHPNDPTRRLLSVVKSNLAEVPPSLAYSIVKAGDTSKVEWHGEVATCDDDPVAESEGKGARAKLEEAKRLLESALQGGEKPAKELLKEAEDAGIGSRTLSNAKAALGVQSDRKTDGSGKGYWVWLWPME